MRRIAGFRGALRAAGVALAGVVLVGAGLVEAQTIRPRKYTPPPATSHIQVTVLKATNGKPIQNAAVVFHPMKENKDEGNMELKTNEEGKAELDVIPVGSLIRLQVLADGFQTYGEDYEIREDKKEIVVKMKRPANQYSTYQQTGSSKETVPVMTATPQGGTQAGGGNKPTAAVPAAPVKPAGDTPKAATPPQ